MKWPSGRGSGYLGKIIQYWYHQKLIHDFAEKWEIDWRYKYESKCLSLNTYLYLEKSHEVEVSWLIIIFWFFVVCSFRLICKAESWKRVWHKRACVEFSSTCLRLSVLHKRLCSPVLLCWPTLSPYTVKPADTAFMNSLLNATPGAPFSPSKFPNTEALPMRVSAMLELLCP